MKEASLADNEKVIVGGYGSSWVATRKEKSWKMRAVVTKLSTWAE